MQKFCLSFKASLGQLPLAHLTVALVALPPELKFPLTSPIPITYFSLSFLSLYVCSNLISSYPGNLISSALNPALLNNFVWTSMVFSTPISQSCPQFSSCLWAIAWKSFKRLTELIADIVRSIYRFSVPWSTVYKMQLWFL